MAAIIYERVVNFLISKSSSFIIFPTAVEILVR